MVPASSRARHFLLPVLAAGFGLAGCGGGGGGGPAYSITTSVEQVDFAGVQGQPLPSAQTVVVDFEGEGLVVGFAPGVPPPPWLNVILLTAPNANPATLQFSLAPLTYSPGVLATSVRLVTGTLDGSRVVFEDLPVRFDFVEPFSVTRSSVGIQSIAGATADSRSFAIRGTRLNWTITPDQPWIQLSSSAGTAAGTINVTANPAGLSRGTYAGNLLVQDALSGSSATVAVTFGITGNRWNASPVGVQLIEYADAPAVPAATRITNDFATADNWIAAADVAWLDITAAGSNGDDLVVQPNAAAAVLAADTSHFATVTVSGAGLPADTLRVGYYRSSNALPAQLQASPIPITTATRPARIAVDPVRPVAYVAFGTSVIYRAHLITGAVTPLRSEPGAIYLGPVVSGDGRRLYASEGGGVGGGIVIQDLETGAARASIPNTAGCCPGSDRSTVWIRQGGQPLLVTSQRQVINPDTGIVSQTTTVPLDSTYPNISPRGDDRTLDFYSLGTTNLRTVPAFQLTARPGVGDGFLTAFATRVFPGLGGNGGDIIVEDFAETPDGAVTFVLGDIGGGGPFNALYRFTPTTGTVIDTNRNSAVSVAPDGRGLAARFVQIAPGFGSAYFVYVIDAGGSIVQQYTDYFSEVNDLEFSADGRQALVLGSATTIQAGQALHVFRLP